MTTARLWSTPAQHRSGRRRQHGSLPTNIRNVFQNNTAEGPTDLQGPFLYQEGGKTYVSLPMGMLQNIQRSLLFEKMKMDCQAEGIEIPKTIMAKDLVTHVLTPQEYLQKVEAGTMSPMDNHQMMKEMAENATVNSQMKFMMMKFRDIECPTPPKTPQEPKRK